VLRVHGLRMGGHQADIGVGPQYGAGSCAHLLPLMMRSSSVNDLKFRAFGTSLRVRGHGFRIIVICSASNGRHGAESKKFGRANGYMPNKPRGVPRVDDRHVVSLNGIFWVLQPGAPWRDLPSCMAHTLPATTAWSVDRRSLSFHHQPQLPSPFPRRRQSPQELRLTFLPGHILATSPLRLRNGPRCELMNLASFSPTRTKISRERRRLRAACIKRLDGVP
jgi:hypothetical protein